MDCFVFRTFLFLLEVDILNGWLHKTDIEHTCMMRFCFWQLHVNFGVSAAMDFQDFLIVLHKYYRIDAVGNFPLSQPIKKNIRFGMGEREGWCVCVWGGGL